MDPNDDSQTEASTSSLVARFQTRDEEEEEGHDRKPVRKMTPPREDIERDVNEYQRRYSKEIIERDPDIVISGDRSQEVDELPPKAVTSSLLAKFKSFEDTTAPPPLPNSPKKAPTSGKSRHTTVTTTTTTEDVRKPSQLTPDSGISLSDSPNEGSAETVSQQFEGEVVRESDRNDSEELPEQGFTKSLLTKWKAMEQNMPPAPQQAKAPSTKRSWSYKEQKASSNVVRSNGTTYTTPSSSSMGAEDERYGDEADTAHQETGEARQVVRESDNNEEEFLPPPSFTKNMLAKFRNMEQESDHGTQQAAAPRKVSTTTATFIPPWCGFYPPSTVVYIHTCTYTLTLQGVFIICVIV